MGGCLIIKNDGIGDIVLIRELINHISDCYDGDVDLVCCEIVKPIVEHDLNIRKVYYVSRDPHFTLPNPDRRTFLNYLKDVLKSMVRRPTEMDRRVRTEIAQQDYDIAIVMRRFIRQSSLYFMSAVRAREKLCVWQYPTNLTVNRAEELSKDWIRIQGSHETLHESVYYRSVLRDRFPGMPDSLPIFTRDSRRVGGAKRIALVLGNVKKGLSPDIWMEIIRALLERGHSVEIFGGADTAKTYSRFIQRNGIDSHADRLDLVESQDRVTSKFQVALGNDTGLLHQVAPHIDMSIIICGGETPLRFFPWPGSWNQYVLLNCLDCYDCGYCRLRSRECMGFHGDDIVSLICRILDGEVQPGVHNLGKNDTYNIAHRWQAGLSHSLRST